jgi:hypothetical protein
MTKIQGGGASELTKNDPSDGQHEITKGKSKVELLRILFLYCIFFSIKSGCKCIKVE